MGRRKIKGKKPKNRRSIEADNVIPFELPDRRAVEKSMADFVDEHGSTDARDRAQQLMYDAWETPDHRTRTKLARKALEIYSDCTDALSCLAEDSIDPEEALTYYRLAVEAGERDLGPESFTEDVGHFWGFLKTRPYMRAREGLAQALRAVGRIDEAAEHYEEMLRLNPNDNQGVRMQLLPLLIELDRDEDAASLLERYYDDAFSAMTYGRALLEFRASGDSDAAQERLSKALEANKHVPALLTGKKKMPRTLPDYHGFGDKNEAVAVVHDSRDSWRRTPGALDWLKARTS
jgi:tetratricopeptide (TPR) repeat protein